MNCELADKCYLVNVVMGKNCTIGMFCFVASSERVHTNHAVRKLSGSGSVLKNCVLWDNVVVESDCVIENSVLCDNTTIGQKARLSGRCIIGSQVTFLFFPNRTAQVRPVSLGCCTAWNRSRSRFSTLQEARARGLGYCLGGCK